jgi:hypothetical protein
MRPLYLDGSQALQVSLDGPALCVEGESRADGRYPLSRVTRVVVRGPVEWRTEALLACLRSGIPVTFLDHRGDAEALCFGARHRERGLGSYLREFLDLANWRDQYAIWFSAMERRAVLNACRALGLRLDDLRPEQARQAILNSQSRRFWGVRLGPYYRYLKGLLVSHTAEVLSRAGLEADLMCWRREGLNLVLDFARLQEWDLHALVRALLDAAPQPRDLSHRALTAAFEAQAAQRDRRIEVCLHSFERWLRELLG